MPPIQSPSKILLTGANGYFAVHAVKDLLDRGHTVVGTVRSESKGEELLKVFPGYTGKLSYAVVPNIAKAGAFDQVLRDGNFDAVAHAASPVLVPSGAIEDYVKPAIEGTVGILESIKAHGQTVKRVVITSSSVAISTGTPPGCGKRDETQWNDSVVKIVQEQGEKSNSFVLYFYSKTVAEKAVWTWWSENKEYVGWDLATINPTLMLGEPIHSISSRDQLTSTNGVLSSLLPPHEDLTERPWGLIHVGDVAAIHSSIFEWRENVTGRRVIAVASEPSWQDMYKALSDFPGVPRGTPVEQVNPDVGCPSWDNAFARELLGREFIGTKYMLVETEGYYRKKGWSFFA